MTYITLVKMTIYGHAQDLYTGTEGVGYVQRYKTILMIYP
jgi:hypothetical protein